MQYAKHFNPSRTPQTERAKPNQVANSAGGYSFAVDDWKRLERFLILGAEGGTYYASERKLTRENAIAVQNCLAQDPDRAVKTIVEISESGRAPKNDQAVFALALAAAHDNARARSAAFEALPRVCRIGTHLFQFAAAVDQFRGWGRGLRRAVGRWYTSKTPRDLAFQVAKYGQREGWSHKDMLALSHGTSMELNPVLRYIAAGIEGGGDRVLVNQKTGRVREYADPGLLPDFIQGFEELKSANVSRTIELIQQHGFTHEMIRTEHKNSAAVWEALLQRMPMTAMIRNLGKMSQVGLLAPMSAASKIVAERIQDPERLRSSRVHPIHLLSALMVYRQGHGEKGSLTWAPVKSVVDGLDAGFYEAFGVIEPSNKNTLLALDVSGSMTLGTIAGVPGLTPRTGSACMAMVTARVEPNYEIVGFSHKLIKLDITPRRRLDDVVAYLDRLPFGATNCSLPMQWALQEKLAVDTFVVYTDSETYMGNEHPHQSLERYRRATGIASRSAVVGMVSNGFTIADPNDAGQLDVVGFDSNTPALLAAFARGEV